MFSHALRLLCFLIRRVGRAFDVDQVRAVGSIHAEKQTARRIWPRCAHAAIGFAAAAALFGGAAQGEVKLLDGQFSLLAIVEPGTGSTGTDSVISTSPFSVTPPPATGFSLDGRNATAMGTAQFDLGSTSGTLAGPRLTFISSGSASAASDVIAIQTAASVDGHLVFTLSRPYNYTLESTGTSNPTRVGFTLTDPTVVSPAVRIRLVHFTGPVVVEVSTFENGITNTDGDRSGTLQPGKYTFAETLNVLALFDAFRGLGTPTSSGSFTSQFKLTPADDFLYWNSTTGSFREPANWDPNQVPGQDDTVVFDTPADDYLVTFTQNEMTDTLKIEDVDVGFLLSGKTYTLGGQTDGKSLVVGASSSTLIARLVLEGGAGSELKALGDVSIGTGSLIAVVIVNDFATLSVAGNLQLVGHNNGSAGLGIDQGTVTVAGTTQVAVDATTDIIADNGFLNLENQSHLTTSRLEIGVSGSGSASVLSGSSVFSDEVLLGVNSGSIGTLTVSGTNGT